MQRKSKALLGAVGLVAAIIATAKVAPTAFATFVFSTWDPCANTELATAVAPGGSHRAVVFQRDCGATSGFSTQVSVLPLGAALPNDGGNVFVADAADDRVPAGLGGGPAVGLVWRDERTLVIRHHRLARVFRSEPRAGGIQVRYELR
ncbi:MAG TPA: hypothetical protein VE913_07375 [Longimicrobium sp.]|nr:hypothetical protein [Longimicrobium sp.]